MKREEGMQLRLFSDSAKFACYPFPEARDECKCQLPSTRKYMQVYIIGWLVAAALLLTLYSSVHHEFNNNDCSVLGLKLAMYSRSRSPFVHVVLRYI